MSLSTQPPVRILVIRTGAVGDFILTTPVLNTLRSAYPSAHISVLGHPSRTTLADHLIDRHVDIDLPPWSRLFAPDAHLDGEHHDLVVSADLILNYLPDPDGILTRNLTTLCDGTVVSHSPHPPEDGSVHIIDHLLEPVDALGIPAHRSPTVAVTRPPLALDRFVVLHPGSGGQHKVWPAQRYAEVADALTYYGDVVVTSGPADEACINVMKTVVRDAIFPDPMSLPEFAGLLQSARLYVGNDSGPTHLAAAVGTPTVAIFGPTDPRIWGPVGPEVEIVAGDDKTTAGVSISSVIKAVNRLI